MSERVRREILWIRTRAQVKAMEREAIETAASPYTIPPEHARLRSMLLNRLLRREGDDQRRKRACD
jgi:hypothetical protein